MTFFLKMKASCFVSVILYTHTLSFKKCTRRNARARLRDCATDDDDARARKALARALARYDRRQNHVGVGVLRR